MPETRYQEEARRILSCWETSLLELQPRYEEAVFPALVACLGIQNGLWPLWVQICKAAGHSLDEAHQIIRLADPELHQLPWFCVTNPFNAEAAWLLVRGSGVPDSAVVFPELMRSDICASLLTLNAKEPPIIYGQAAEVFARWGLYSDKQKLESFGTVRGLDEVPSGGRSELRIPVAHCKQLLEDWPLWRKSLLLLEEELESFVVECVASGSCSNSLRHDFMLLADALWYLLQEVGLIHCALFDSGKVSFRDIFRPKKILKFRGFLVLFGDHQQLWQEVRKPIAPPHW